MRIARRASTSRVDPKGKGQAVPDVPENTLLAARAVNRREQTVRGPTSEGFPSAESVLALQRTAGNAAVGWLLARQHTVTQMRQKKDADLESAASIFARLAGLDHRSAEEEVEFVASSLGRDGKTMKRVAEGLTRLARLKDRSLYEEALEVNVDDLEPYWSLASSLDKKHSRLTVAIRLVRDLRIKLHWDLVPILQSDEGAASGLLGALPPTQLEQLWVDVETASGLSASSKEWVKTRTSDALRKAATGESVDARLERDRGRAVGEQLEKRVRHVSEDATFARRDFVRLIKEGVGHVDATKQSMLEIAEHYTKSHQEVLRTIQEAKAEAALEEKRMEMLLDLAIGVGVVLGLGAAVPLAEEASHATHQALEIAGKVTEVAIGDVLKSSPRSERLPSDFEKAQPALKEAEAYKRCGELYRTLALLSDQAETIGEVSDLVSKVGADARELAAAGVHRTMVIPELERRVAGLEDVRTRLQSVVHDVFDVTTTLDATAKAAGRSAKLVDERRMEKQIWVRWVASLSDEDAALAGEEPIKSVLNSFHIVAPEGGDSMIGWGVGWWHSEENSRTGVKKAQVYAKALDLVGQEGRLVWGGPREFEGRGDFEARTTPGEGPLGYHLKKMIGTFGKMAVEGVKDGTYTVQVMGSANPGDVLVITGVMRRDEKSLYVGGDDPSNFGPVLIARQKPRSGEEARRAAAEDWEPTGAF